MMMSKEESLIMKWLGEEGVTTQDDWRRQVVKRVEETGLKKENAMDRPKWRDTKK